MFEKLTNDSCDEVIETSTSEVNLGIVIFLF